MIKVVLRPPVTIFVISGRYILHEICTNRTFVNRPKCVTDTLVIIFFVIFRSWTQVKVGPFFGHRLMYCDLWRSRPSVDDSYLATNWPNPLIQTKR